MPDDFEALDAYSAAVIRVAESVLPNVASLRVDVIAVPRELTDA